MKKCLLGVTESHCGQLLWTKTKGLASTIRVVTPETQMIAVKLEAANLVLEICRTNSPWIALFMLDKSLDGQTTSNLCENIIAPRPFATCYFVLLGGENGEKNKQTNNRI